MERERTIKEEKFLFGLISMPKMPLLHVFMLMTLGSACVVYATIRKLDIEKAKMLLYTGHERYHQDPVDLGGVIWITIICVYSAYSMFRTWQYRVMMNTLHKELKAMGMEDSDIRNDEMTKVVDDLRSSVIGIILSLVIYGVFILFSVFYTTWMLNLTIKYL